MSLLEQTIELTDPLDKATGFLTNQSNYGFSLDKKWWPTVEHYIRAKKFEGTEYEEIIRRAETPWKLSILTKGKGRIVSMENGVMKKDIVYGTSRDREFHIRSDWGIVCPQYLEKAIYAKFKQNSKILPRIVDTGISKFVDKTKSDASMYTGTVLEKVRARILQKPVSEKKSDHINTKKDFTLSRKYSIILHDIIWLLLEICKSEGQSKIYPEMLEDLIFNITSDVQQADELGRIVTSCQNVEWTHLYSNTPQFAKILSFIHNIFFTKQKVEKSNMYTALGVGYILRWLDQLPAATSSEIIEKIQNLHSGKNRIIFPKRKRWYRGCPQYDNHLSYKKLGRKTYVIGPIKTHLSKLKSMGGVFKNNMTVIFKGKRPTKTVKSYVYSTMPSRERYEKITQKWLETKIALIYDVCVSWIQMTSKSKEISADVVKFVMSEIFCLNKSFFEESKETMKSFDFTNSLYNIISSCDEYKLYSLSDNSETILSNWFNNVKILNISNGMDLDYEDFLTRLSSIFGKDKNIASLRGYTKTQHHIARAVLRIVHYLKKQSKDSDREIYIQAFLMLVPRRKRVMFRLLLDRNKISSMKMSGLISIYHSDKISRELENIFSMGMDGITKMIEKNKQTVSRILHFSKNFDFGKSDTKKHVLLSQETCEWIGVIANATSRKIPSGNEVTDSVYERFPYSNIYKANKTGLYTLGSIIISQPKKRTKIISKNSGDIKLKTTLLPSTTSSRYVVSLIAEHSEGGPKKFDTKENRRKWFESALKSLKARGIQNIAFSGQQLGSEYIQILGTYTSKGLNVNIY